MKRCPECRRDYYDETLLYCLDDGNPLLEGPATGDERATAILHTNHEPHGVLSEHSARQGHSSHQYAELNRKFGGRSKLLLVSGILVLLLIAGFFGYRYFAGAPSKQIDSIAVMPFVNASGNADNEYLSDGITETLISSLTNLPFLTVKARSSVFRYKGKEMDTKNIGKELNVQAILTGRVIQRGDQLTLSLELVDVATENAIWSQQYSRKQSDLVTLQSDIARDVSSKLKSKLSGADEAKVTKISTVNPEAYQLYLKGRYFWNKRTPEDIRKAIEFFDQAIETDPLYALAYSGLADCYNLQGLREVDPKEAFPKAKAMSLKALEIDETLAEAHNSLGFFKHRFDWDFAGAEIEFKRAVELNPGYATAHQWYAWYFASVGKFAEAIEEMKNAKEIDPLSLEINADFGLIFHYSHQDDQAITELRKAVGLDPSFGYSHNTLARAYLQKGMFSEAITHGKQARRLAPESPGVLSNLCYIYAVSGHRSEAQQLLIELEAMAKQRYVNPTSFALAYLGFGDKDKALEMLNNGYEERSPALALLKADRIWDGLRDDPRYKELVKKVGIPE